MTSAGTPFGEPRRDALADNPMSVEEIRDWTENAVMTSNLRAGMRALLAQAAAQGDLVARLVAFVEELATGWIKDQETTVERGELCVLRDVLQHYRVDARALLAEISPSRTP